MMIAKRGQAHVEIILATTLFVGFLIFIFVFLNSSLKTAKPIPTDEIEKALLDEMQSEIGKLLLVKGTKNEDSCIYMEDLDKIYGTNYRTVNEGLRYTLYYGRDFNKLNLPKCSKKNSDFVTGGYLEEKMIIESKIRDLVSAYDEYSALKSRLGIGNFAFQFRDPDTNEIISDLSVIGKVPDNSDVISKDFPIRVIDGNAEMSNLILNIKAWR